MTLTEEKRIQAEYDRKVRELSSALADMVREGALTDNEANEWMVCKQEQWMKDLR